MLRLGVLTGGALGGFVLGEAGSLNDYVVPLFSLKS